MTHLNHILADLLGVLRDVLPVAVTVALFQWGALKKPLPNPRGMMTGFVAVIVGLQLFLTGLEMSVFPVGEGMALEMARPGMRAEALFFAFFIGYATTVAEPALLAVAMKAEEITAGGLQSLALRNAVALGVGIGIALGVWRIFTGDPLWAWILAGYVVALALTMVAPKAIVPLAYDTGGVTTSTITVPLVAALGLGVAANTPGRDPLADGFGLIAFASVFPMITVLAYAIIADRFPSLVPKKRS